MGYPTKIATCCHCGTRAALRLNTQLHVLSCASCGAPLRQLKMLPKAAPVQPDWPAVTHRPAPKARPAGPAPVGRRKPVKRRKAKKRKGWLRHMAEEMFDLVEDIFD